uniref:Uncharacterized protein n=1 Tax=Cannabis sativa TaxID=3483 RepID=A0A803Q2Y3_CANSA
MDMLKFSCQGSAGAVWKIRVWLFEPGRLLHVLRILRLGSGPVMDLNEEFHLKVVDIEDNSIVALAKEMATEEVLVAIKSKGKGKANAPPPAPVFNASIWKMDQKINSFCSYGMVDLYAIKVGVLIFHG